MNPNGMREEPIQLDIRQRVGAVLFRAIGPLVRLVVRRGLPAGPNVLLIVRGRTSGRPRATPVALWELGDRRFVQASFGEVSWVRNVRAAGTASIRRGRSLEHVRAVELSPEAAGVLMHSALAGFRRWRLLRPLLGPTVRPPVAILYRYRLRVDDQLVDYVADARRHPLFELIPDSAVRRASPTATPPADPGSMA